MWSAFGILLPLASTSYIALPSVPDSLSFRPYSSPDWPCPSAPTTPTTFAAMVPFGWLRIGSDSVYRPVSNGCLASLRSLFCALIEAAIAFQVCGLTWWAR